MPIDISLVIAAVLMMLGVGMAIDWAYGTLLRLIGWSDTPDSYSRAAAKGALFFFVYLIVKWLLG